MAREFKVKVVGGQEWSCYHDGMAWRFYDEDGDERFAWFKHLDADLAREIIAVYHRGFDAGASFGSASVQHDIKRALGLV